MLAALVFFGGGGVRGIESALWGYVGLFVCAPSDYSVMEALESDGVNRAAREAFASERELEASCDPDDRSISGEIRLSSTDPWEVVLRTYQELMSSNGWVVEGRVPMCYQKSVEGRVIEAYLLRGQRTEDAGVKMVIAFSSRPGGCELLDDPELGEEWMQG
ncbi:hypothetical protein ACIO3S_11505 [Nocardioides sp. NPDC087217]|uniref:hypothetical protein n=1 Tax=Nocardioides sp. NPDC087217 TaxID=3364335 RepID=UPI0038086501